MFTIRKIEKRKDYKKFVKFPTELYKDNPNYIPPMEMDEFKMTTPKNAHFEECDQAYFLAEQDGKVVGRIAALVMHKFNEKNNSKYARFSRFDVIENEEIAHALLETAEKWAKEQGMEYIHGPLGYDDLEREGLMVYGFDKKGSFITSYNAEYYQGFIENFGYQPDARWVEWRFQFPQKQDERVERVASLVEKRYGFHEKHYSNVNELIKNHKEEFFDLLDESFSELYGTMPMNEELRKQVVSTFKLVLKPEFLCLVFDRSEKLIGFGLTWPSLADAMQKTKGRALPFGFLKWLKAIKHPKAVELGIISVKKEYQKLGVTAFIIKKLMDRLSAMPNIQYADTGVQLETNTGAIGSLDMFERELIRRKTCYIKKLD
ncbi:MAG: GNAT family N-acetyltransferase [Clostridia bacterium]|nr:GNAT family N-acetyltransferase [Clostridia bacterium]